MRTSMLLKMLLTAAMFHMFATDDETASAAPATDTADTSAADTIPTDTPTSDLTPADVAPDSGATQTADTAVADTASTNASTSAPQTTAPAVQTPTPVAQPGSAGDPVLETVKTPAHRVAEEIQAAIKKLEELPPEVAAWFEAKFTLLASHIKALL